SRSRRRRRVQRRDHRRAAGALPPARGVHPAGHRNPGCRGRIMSDWTTAAATDMMQVFGEPQAMLVRGSGCYVWDADGTEYLDFLGGIAVNALGHAHPVMVDAISRQAAELIHVSNYFVTPPQLELAARLKRLTGAGEQGRVYFSNSGAEANEAAFKLARLNSGGGARTRILALNGSFHGRTMGALALTG